MKTGSRLAVVAVLFSGSWGVVRAETKPDAPHEIKNLQKAPKLLKGVDPEYPYALSRAGLAGEVTIEFVIDPHGNVTNPYVVESNNPWFERAAIEAILLWKFTPGEVNGRPVNVRALQKIEFSLWGGGEVPVLWHVAKGKDQEKLPVEFRWDLPPTPAATMFPVYPVAQLRAETAGRARIWYVVGPDGRVTMARLQDATAPEFGAAVLAMIEAWHFQPAKKKDGTPCYASLSSEYQFSPKGGDVPVSDEARKILRNLEKKPETIVSMTGLDHPVRPLSRRPPVYPSAFLESGQPGQTLIEFFIDKNGDAQLPRIVSSSAAEFGYAAVQAVATWRFEVPRKGGKPVVVKAQVPIDFSQQKPGVPAP